MAALLILCKTSHTVAGITSLGGAIITTSLVTSDMNSLFDNVFPAEASGGYDDYRAIDIFNNGDDDSFDVGLWFSAQPATIKLRIGIEPGGSNHAVETGGGAWMGQTIANEITPPTGMTFTASNEYTVDSQLTIPNINLHLATRIWIQRHVPIGTLNKSIETATITLKYA